MLTDMYNGTIKNVQMAVKNSMATALTSDFWTSLGKECCCAIIGHWITVDWNLIGVVLECVHFVERHYSTSIAELHTQFGEDLDITKKIEVLVTDNVRNVASAVNQTGLAHIPCLAHSMHLSIFHGFKVADAEILSVICRKRTS